MNELSKEGDRYQLVAVCLKKEHGNNIQPAISSLEKLLHGIVKN